jgi:hypothetical protein
MLLSAQQASLTLLSATPLLDQSCSCSNNGTNNILGLAILTSDTTETDSKHRVGGNIDKPNLHQNLGIAEALAAFEDDDLILPEDIEEFFPSFNIESVLNAFDIGLENCIARVPNEARHPVALDRHNTEDVNSSPSPLNSEPSVVVNKVDYVHLMSSNSITKRVTTEVKENILRPYLENDLPYVPDQELVRHKFHVQVMKKLPLKNVINGNRHVSKEIEGILLMAIIAEYLNRCAISHDADDYTIPSFAKQFPDIYGKACPYLSPKFKLETLVDVWKVFNVAIHEMKIPVSANKSSLLVAANLLSDPERAMTTGSRQVVRTECAIELFHAVSGHPISKRPTERCNSESSPAAKKRRTGSISSIESIGDLTPDLASLDIAKIVESMDFNEMISKSQFCFL